VLAIFFAFTLLEGFCNTVSGLDCGIVSASEKVAAFGGGLSEWWGVHRVNSVLSGMFVLLTGLRGMRRRDMYHAWKIFIVRDRVGDLEVDG
jgi:hypothetical protein